MWHFQVNVSSIVRPRNFVSVVLVIWFFNNIIFESIIWLFVVRNCMYVVLLGFSDSRLFLNHSLTSAKTVFSLFANCIGLVLLTFILRAHQTFKCPSYERTRPRALQPFKSTVHSCIGLELQLHSLSPNFIMVCDQNHAPANLPNYVHMHLTNSKSLAIL